MSDAIVLARTFAFLGFCVLTEVETTCEGSE
jgi:hypothetical protein